MGDRVVRNKTLDVPDGDRLVQFPPTAGDFTGMCADPAANAWKYVIPANQIQGFREFSSLGKGHISLRVYPQRAVGLTQGLAAFINDGVAGKTLPTAGSNGL